MATKTFRDYVNSASFINRQSNMGVLDIECLKDVQGNMIIKEIAYAGRNKLCSFLVKSPRKAIPDIPTNVWLQENRQTPAWSDGYIALNKVKKMLKPLLFERVYAKGLEKFKLLETVFNIPVFNLEDEGCPSIAELNSDAYTCHHHNTDLCAQHKAQRLYTWLTSSDIIKFRVNK